MRYSDHTSKGKYPSAATSFDAAADSWGIDDVQGCFRDLLIREEDAAGYLRNISEQLAAVGSSIARGVELNPRRTQRLNDDFLFGVGQYEDISHIIERAYFLRCQLGVSIQVLNDCVPTMADDLRGPSRLSGSDKQYPSEANREWLALGGGSLGATSALFGFGALTTPLAPMALPLVAVGVGIAGVALSETHIRPIIDSAQRINEEVEELGQFASRVGDCAETLISEIAKLEEEDQDSTQEY